MPFVLDASVALSFFFGDETSQFKHAALRRLEQGEVAVVPALFYWEFLNGLLTATRRGRLDSAKAQLFVELVESLPIEIDPTPVASTVGTTFQLAQRLKLSGYDSAYLEIAVRLGLDLATLDLALAAAAQTVNVATVA